MDNNLLYVTHIRDELLFLMRMRDSLSYESLLEDDVKQRAIIRRFHGENWLTHGIV